jgi:hypothetical protein
MAGELNRYLNLTKRKPDKEQMELWRKFLMNLTIALKNKDANCLMSRAVLKSNYRGSVEIKAARKVYNYIVRKAGHESPDKVPLVELQKMLKSLRDLTEYEEGAVNAANRRLRSGGMVSDRWAAVGTILLVYLRGLPENQVLKMLEKQKDAYKGTSVRKVKLPWYAFDMHTRPGLRAMNAWMKHYNSYGMDRGQFKRIFFWAESAKIGAKVRAKQVKPDSVEIARFNQEMWRRVDRDHCLSFETISPTKMLKLWEEKHRGEMKKLVEWSLGKV